MKTTIYLIICILFLTIGLPDIQAQSTNENYIYTWDVMLPETNSDALTNMVCDSKAIKTIQYFDGLGRPLQTVQKGFTYKNSDLIKPYEYNEFGIDTINYQPYSDYSSSGIYRVNYKSDLGGFYTNGFGDENGKSPVMFEKSPLQRVLKQGAPGASWQIEGHPVSFYYLSNDNTNELKVKNWKVVGNGCQYVGFYDIGELYVTKVMNEDSAVTFEFKNKSGNIILKRNELTSTSFADTYYIYDDFELLRFVISPEGSQAITTDFSFTDALVKKYVYCYTYDSRKRLVEKRIPGKESEYYIYAGFNSLMQLG